MAPTLPLIGRTRELTALALLLRADVATAVLLRGPAGIGKTRLALAAAAATPGRTPAVLRASAAQSRSRFGALRELLSELGGDAGAPAQRLADEFATAAAAAAAVLVVDDAPALDAGSSAAVAQLVVAAELPVLMTARDGAQLGPELAALVDDGWVIEFGVEPLGDGAILQLAEAWLGGTVDPESAVRLATDSAGNPLFLLELMRSAAAGDAVHITGGVHSIERLVPSPRLTTMLARRFAGLSSQARMLAEVIAAAQPLPVDLGRRDGRALDELLGHELVTIEHRSDGERARLSHPLFDDVLRAAMGPERWRDVAATAAGLLQGAAGRAAGPAATELRLRALDLLLDAGTEIDTAAAAAALAGAARLGDDRLALRLAGAILAREPGHVDAALARARVLSHRHDPDAAGLLGGVLGAARTDRDIARAGRELAVHRGAVEFDPAGAVAALEAALARVGDPVWRRFLAADLVHWQIAAGLTPTADGLDEAARDALSALAGHRVAAQLASVDGRYGEARREAAAGIAIARRHPDLMADAEPMLAISDYMALICAGDLDGAERTAGAQLDAFGRRDVGWLGLWESMLAMVELARGDASAADRRMERAVRASRWRDAPGVIWLAHAYHAKVLAQLGRGDEGRTVYERIPADQLLDPRVVMAAAEARAWLAWQSGRLGGAPVEELAAGARLQAGQGQRGLAVVSAYDAARLGRPELVATLLTEAAAVVDGPLVEAMAATVRGQVAGDAALLEHGAERFAQLGFIPYAADAAALAARVAAPAEAERLGRRAAGLAAGIDAAVVHAQVAGAQLTGREREIATLAAAGARSKEIAQRLGLSPRTVDNHLLRAYRKLGVRRRDELGPALATGR